MKELNRKLNGEIKQNKTYYICKCSCGNIKSITKSDLKNSKTISLTGNVRGSATWDASGNLSISTTVSGGFATDNTKVAKAGDTMTG